MKTSNTDIFFSVIIPVYNGLSHDLPICLDSIWNQPLAPSLYEVICVDDCSNDRTREWLEEQKENHFNLNVVKNNVNIRQGGGRNRGVREAQGKYIMFIDQDDYYHQGAFELVYKHISMNLNLEVFVSDSAYQFKGHESNKLQLNLPFREVCTGCEFIQRNGAVIAPWRMAIQRLFYQKYQIYFSECCRIEDVDWACKVLFYANRIQYSPILLVHYNKAESGQTDNMYRNIEILEANTIAGNRTLNVAESLYKNSLVYQNIIDVVETYYNYSCKYLFGMYVSIAVKRNIVKLIKIDQSKFPLVNFALKHTTVFCIVTNLSWPVFRITRLIRRWIKARYYET